MFAIWPCVLQAEEKPRVDVWIINTRCAPVSGDLEKGKERIRYWRLGEKRQWDAAEAVSFAESGEKNTPTIFLFHGNRTTDDEAVPFAWPIYRWLYKQAGERPYRVVIWSWPSTLIYKRTRPDVQLKACYCDSQGYYLADCLRSMKSETPIGLIGYSLGARIITGGLHLLGGGTLADQRLPAADAAETSRKRGGPIRAFLVAAALDCHALAPGQQYGEATSQVEEMLVTWNGCDNALRWYPLLYGRGGPQALGYAGPCCGNQENIRLFDVTYSIGKEHHWEGYIDCSCLFDVLPRYVFAEEK